MFRSKRIATTILALTVMLTMALSACSSKSASPSPQTTSSVLPQPSSSPDLEPVNLVWYLRRSAPNNAESVVKKANELIKQKINATVDFKFVNPGDYDTKMQLVMSSGEVYDLAYTSLARNPYLNNVNRGAYVAIDDLLAKYPDVKGKFVDELWDAVKVNGKTYGVPNRQIMSNQPGMWFKKDLVQKYNIDVTKIKSMSDLTAIFQMIKDKEPGVIPTRGGQAEMIGLFAPYIPQVEGLNIDTKTWTVMDPYTEIPAIYQDYQVMRDWYQKGFFPQDVATLKDEVPLLKSGKVFSRYGRQTPGGEALGLTTYGFETINFATNKPVISKTSVLSTITAISSTSKNPDRAMMLINLMNTDKELINLLSFGIEGQDYKKVSDNRIEPIPNGYIFPAWMLGDVFNTYLIPGQPDDVWEQTKKVDASADIDPLMAFNFDPTPVQTEIANLGAINDGGALINGLDDPDKVIKILNDKRKAAGLDKVVAEVNRQLAEWRKTAK